MSCMSSYPDANVIESVLNSTTTPLGSSATFTGTGEKIDQPQLGIMVKTDVSGTLYFDFSSDGVNWDSTYPTNGFILQANISAFHTAVKLGRYFRVRLVNDSTAQTFLRLTTYYGSNFIPSIAPLNQSINLDQDAIVTRATNSQDDIRLGRRNGVTGWNKFGYRTGLTASGGEQTIWGTTGNFTPSNNVLTTASTFTITYDGTTGGSTDGSGTNGARELTFFYIDDSGLPAVSVHTLGTVGSDVTTFSGLGINQIAVTDSGSDGFNASDITVTATTGGSTQAILLAEASVTEQAIFFVGSNHQAIATFLWVNVLRTSGGSTPKVLIKGYVYNRNLAVRYLVFRAEIDTNVQNTLEITDPIGFNLSASDILYFIADTDTNNTNVDLRFSLNEYQRD